MKRSFDRTLSVVCKKEDREVDGDEYRQVEEHGGLTDEDSGSVLGVEVVIVHARSSDAEPHDGEGDV